MTTAQIDRVAQAIYHAAYDGPPKHRVPSPGWCWERCGPVMQAFARRQAVAAIEAYLAPDSPQPLTGAHAAVHGKDEA